MRASEWAQLSSTPLWLYEGPASAICDCLDANSGSSVLLIRQGTLRIGHGLPDVPAGHWVSAGKTKFAVRFSEDAAVLAAGFQLVWPGGHSLFEHRRPLVFSAAQVPELEKHTKRLIRRVTGLLPAASERALPQMHSDLMTYLRIQRHFAAWLRVYVNALLALNIKPARLGPTDARALLAIQRIENWPAEVRFSEKILAQELGLSVSQLNRLFVKHSGISPYSYYNRRRLDKSIEEVRNSPKQLKEVAYDLGFPSLPRFSKWFREQTGCSPRGFRKTGHLAAIHSLG